MHMTPPHRYYNVRAIVVINLIVFGHIIKRAFYPTPGQWAWASGGMCQAQVRHAYSIHAWDHCHCHCPTLLSHSHWYTVTLSLSLSHSHAHDHTVTVPLFLSQCRCHAVPFTLSMRQCHCQTVIHTVTLSFCHCHFHTVTVTDTVTITLSHCQCHSNYHSLSHSNCHTITVTQSLSHCHSYCHCQSYCQTVTLINGSFPLCVEQIKGNEEVSFQTILFRIKCRMQYWPAPRQNELLLWDLVLLSQQTSSLETSNRVSPDGYWPIESYVISYRKHTKCTVLTYFVTFLILLHAWIYLMLNILHDYG